MMFNEIDRIGINELNNHLQALIKRNLFSIIKISGNDIIPTKTDDILQFIAGDNIKITPDLANRALTFAITGKVLSAAQADEALSVDWTNVQNKPADWITSYGDNYVVYNSGRIEQWGKIITNRNNWTYNAFPISFNDVTEVSFMLTPVCKSDSYKSSSPTYAPNVRAISETGFYSLLTNAGSNWDMYYYAIAK